MVQAEAVQRVAAEVHDELDRLFPRFTSFPTNVLVTVLDRIDVDQMFQPGGYDFESPNLLGCIRPIIYASQKRYFMRLMTGLPLVELKATAAHEYSHAWVGENVPLERHRWLARDAEEGFCEMVAFLLMDSQNETAQKKFILQNRYTRGQVDLFIEAVQRYGFDQILDWMQHGETAKLEAGKLEEIRDVKIPAPVSVSAHSTVYAWTDVLAAYSAPAAVPVPEVIKLQGILWGNPPRHINGHTVFANTRFKLKIGGTEMTLRCLEIQKNSVRVENEDSGKPVELRL